MTGFDEDRRTRLKVLQRQVATMRSALDPDRISPSCRCLDTHSGHVTQRCTSRRATAATTLDRPLDGCVLDALTVVAVAWGLLRWPVVQDSRSLYRAVFAAADVLDGLDTAPDEVQFARDLQAAVASALDPLSRAPIPHPYPTTVAELRLP